MSDTEKCRECGDEFGADEVCPDGYCRACHVSLSFDDCVSGRWADEVRAAYGLPPMSDGERRA